MRVDTLDAFAQERDREVRGILQSINDLAQIMKDLSVLVIDQGTIVDRIDYNMEQARPLQRNISAIRAKPAVLPACVHLKDTLCALVYMTYTSFFG